MQSEYPCAGVVCLSDRAVFVKGAFASAVYDLETGDVYSVNHEATQIIDRYVMDGIYDPFLDTLVSDMLLVKGYPFTEYAPRKIAGALLLVWLEITQSCNMKCLHCYEGNVHQGSGVQITLRDWFRVIDEASSIGAKRFVVIGGEPALSRDALDILSYLGKKQITTTFFTNGYYVDGRVLQTILSNGIDVKLSLYGHNAKLHDAITQKAGSFDRLMGAIDKLHTGGANVSIAVTIMKENEAYIDDIKKFLSTLPLAHYKLDVIRQVCGGTQHCHMPTSSVAFKMAHRCKADFYVPRDVFDINMSYNSCWGGKLAVTTNGDVFPCVFARNHICGNVTHSSLNDILKIGLKPYWQLPVKNIKVCGQCEYRYACKDCRPVAESCGDLYCKNPQCLYDPIKGVWNE